jgi:hypothetical protein
VTGVTETGFQQACGCGAGKMFSDSASRRHFQFFGILKYAGKSPRDQGKLLVGDMASMRQAKRFDESHFRLAAIESRCAAFITWAAGPAVFS